jgi:SAM-dependent methyltransferase
MRALPFRTGSFDVIICADNALPHLLTPANLHAALASMHRLFKPGGLLLASTRPYDIIRRTRPRSTLPQVADTSACRAITFQLWDWHPGAGHEPHRRRVPRRQLTRPGRDRLLPASDRPNPAS